MKKRPLRRQRALHACAVSSLFCIGLTYAGSYTNNFDAANSIDGLSIYTISGAPPEVRTTDGNPGGYLKLTDAINSTTSTVVFPDFESGYSVQSFTFAVDCRIGNGTETPADGFSINFCRPGDPVLLNGQGFIAGAAEEGTTTGLAIGFDTYDNGNGDVVGFSIKLDGTILTEVPAATRNGAVDDPNSLQTGPIGSAGWAPFLVELKDDGTLDVTWKGTKVVDGLAIGWTPSPGRIVFAARTGGLNEAHHFDNLSITTTPAPIAALTEARLGNNGFVFTIKDFGTQSVVTPADVTTLLVDGVSVTPTTKTKTGDTTTVTYVPASPFGQRTSHSYELNFRDQNGAALRGIGTLATPFLPSGPLLGTAAATGYWNVREVRDGVIDPFDIGRAADMLKTASNTVDDVSPYINFSDPNSSGDRGLFKIDRNILTDTVDVDDNDIIQAANFKVNVTGSTPEQLQRTFWVQSDDGFALRVSGASNPTVLRTAGLGSVDPSDPSTFGFVGGTGNSNTRAVYQFPAAGEYTIEFLWFEGGGGAFNEIAWAAGNFINNTNDAQWTLVGGGEELAVLPTPLPPTPTGAPAGQWNVREVRNSGYGGSLAGAIDFANQDPVSGDVTDGVSPVINHNDPDGGVGNYGGLFTNDLPFIGDVAGDDNDFYVVARATIPVSAPGLYSLGFQVDDGWAVTVPGAWFVATAGPGGLDPKNSATLYSPGVNDAPTLGVLNIPAAGNYDVFFIAQEGGGGAGWEIFFAEGNFTRVGATAEWELLGANSGLPALTNFLPATIPGPAGEDGAWGIRFIRDQRGSPSHGNNIYNARASVLAEGVDIGPTADGTTPYLNYTDIDADPSENNRGLFRSDNADNGGNYQIADLEYLDSVGGDDQIVAVAKARIVVPATGEWTFGVHSDDGFALRVQGAVFKRVSGDSWIDPSKKDTVFFRFGTGDSNARMVCDLAEGEHDVDFIWFEGGGGSNFELYAAQGGFNEDGESAAWRLVGGPDGLQLVAQTAVPPGDTFAITAVSYTAPALSITFPSEQGVSYTPQWSTTLLPNGQPGGWANAPAVTGAAGQTTTTLNAATLNGGTAPPAFFVRVRR